MPYRTPLATCVLTAVFLAMLPAANASDAPASNEKVIYSFKSLVLAGAFPGGGLIADTVGNLYGTSGGGVFNFGAVFKLRPNTDGTWTKVILYSFQGAPDGEYPRGPLVFDARGNLYGVTSEGGFCNNGCGTVFELSPQAIGTWTEKILYQFTNGNDGQYPTGIIFDKAGNLYGTSSIEAFELAPAAGGKWTFSVLHTFTGLGGVVALRTRWS